MSNRLCTAEVEGHGPIKFLSLTKRQMTRIRHEEQDRNHVAVELLLRRALVEPRPEAIEDADVAYRIATVITDNSWPRREL